MTAKFIETIAFSSRRLVAPFLLGLVLGLAVLLFKFVVKRLLLDFDDTRADSGRIHL